MQNPLWGGGAVLFDMLSRYDMKEIYISDMNKELINTYLVIRDEPNLLSKILEEMQTKHNSLGGVEREQYYYANRDRYNALKTAYNETNVELASLFIYLNKTCYNGLYRVNKGGKFNASFGTYKHPTIYDAENIIDVSKGLQGVKITHGDYMRSTDFIDENTFVYFDPPYRPLTDTASFTGYVADAFTDRNQVELFKFAENLSKRGAKVMISNSDPKNVDVCDNFFENLYEGWNIQKVYANRSINTKKEGRGKINEILIMNYNTSHQDSYIHEKTWW